MNGAGFNMNGMVPDHVEVYHPRNFWIDLLFSNGRVIQMIGSLAPTALDVAWEAVKQQREGLLELPE